MGIEANQEARAVCLGNLGAQMQRGDGGVTPNEDGERVRREARDGQDIVQTPLPSHAVDQDICPTLLKRPDVAVHVRPLPLGRISKPWSEFAADHGGSWRSNPGHIRFTRLRHLLSGRLFAFEAFAQAGPVRGQKIAQCLVSLRGSRITFTDGLQIADGFAAARPAILQQVLSFLPAGHLTFGWSWSLEHVPLEDFQHIPGTSNHQSRDIIVHSVNLANWDSWDNYFRSISNNVRRNVKRAEQAETPVEVIHATGLAAVRLIPQLVRVRRHTLNRVELHHPAWRMALSYLANILTMPKTCHIALARQGGKAFAGLFGYEFGRDFYYWHGGSIENNNGASWKLLTDTVRLWQQKRPDGQFIMGYFDDSLPGYRREGLQRQRESLRKSDYTTRLISFDWTPTNAN
jgi:hypothetical protein